MRLVITLREVTPALLAEQRRTSYMPLSPPLLPFDELRTNNYYHHVITNRCRIMVSGYRGQIEGWKTRLLQTRNS